MAHGRITLPEAVDRLLRELPSEIDLPHTDDDLVTVHIPAGIVRDLIHSAYHHPA